MDSVESNEEMRSAIPTAQPRPVLAIRLGRGRTGGSTFLDILIQRARRAGRKVVIADGDVRNSTLSALYPPGQSGGTLKPASDDLEDMKDLFTRALGEAAMDEASLLVDFGGGDRVMLEYGRETNLVEVGQGLGFEPVAIYVTGPEQDDFEHIVSLWRSRVFQPERALLVLNEHLIPNGRSPEGAFRALMARPEFEEMSGKGVETIVMPRLPCMIQVRETGLNLIDAMNGLNGSKGVPLDLVRRFMVKTWLQRLETAFEKRSIVGWLP